MKNSYIRFFHRFLLLKYFLIQSIFILCISSKKVHKLFLCSKTHTIAVQTIRFKKQTLAQVFYSESCKISRRTFFTEHLRWLLLEFQVFLLIKYFSTSNGSSHTMPYFYIAYWYSNIYGCRYVSKISFCLLPLPLEGEETLKYRCVCRPLFGKV